MSARMCGCDPECAPVHRCGQFPQCAYGRECRGTYGPVDHAAHAGDVSVPEKTPEAILARSLSPAAARKTYPVVTGVIDYFPEALLEIAHVSYVGNEQHNPGQPLHWARGKSMDHADALGRHLIARGTRDTDGMRHTAKVAWRALALLQEELERDKDREEPQ